MDEQKVPPTNVGSNAGLGPANDIRDSAHALIYRWPACTKLHLAKKSPGCFGEHPDMVWSRRLSDDEVEQMLVNPWRMFAGPNVVVSGAVDIQSTES